MLFDHLSDTNAFDDVRANANQISRDVVRHSTVVVFNSISSVFVKLAWIVPAKLRVHSRLLLTDATLRFKLTHPTIL